ncbi:F-box protein (plasmid) [Xanthomonas axonopodis pv. vasculorum]
MPFYRIALPRFAASANRTDEASTSQSPASRTLPNAQSPHIEQHQRFDALTPLPRDLRQEIVRRLDRKSIARLGATSRKMAEAAREGMQAFLATHPCYDPLTDCRSVRSLERLRAALRMVMRLPYPGGEDHGTRLRACLKLIERLKNLPESERAEALMELLEHIKQLPGQPGLPALERLTAELEGLPTEQREAALLKVLQAASAVHDQGAQPDAVQGGDALGVLSTQARLLELVLVGNLMPLPMLLSALADIAAGQPGTPAQAEATLLHQMFVRIQRAGLFMQRYEQVVKVRAGLANGRKVLNHLVDLSVTLPDPQMRWNAFSALATASSQLSRRKDTASVLVRLAKALPQQPQAARYQGGELLIEAALQLDPRRLKAVSAAVCAQAEAIPERSADFIAMCERATALANSRRAASCRCW